MPRYRCLLIDHDDTAVASTAAVHYPAHLEALRQMRPGREAPTLEQWLRWNFHPGIMEYLVGELAMTPAELEREYAIWRSFTLGTVPPFFPGFPELLRDFRAAGGKVAVISHSEADVIEGHYRANGVPGSGPDLVFGWVADASRRKPSAWPAREALRQFGLSPAEALVLDDLKPGVVMSEEAGIALAAAGWGHAIPEIEAWMRAHSVGYFRTVEEFRRFIL